MTTKELLLIMSKNVSGIITDLFENALKCQSEQRNPDLLNLNRYAHE
jgi:hypothetical protein